MGTNRFWKRGGLSALALTLVGTALPMLAPAASADTPTSPTTQSATSLYMSNWTDSMNIWMASQLSQNDTGTYGPRIGEMRIGSDLNTNQIKDYSGFFRDETHSAKYDQIHNFNSEAYYDDGGILRTKYLDYGGSNMPVTVTKDYAMVPNQNFTVATYTFTNSGSSAIDYNLLEQIHVNNKTLGGTNSTNTASYDSTRNALFVNMSNSGQYYVALGAFQTMTGYQAADDTDSSLSSSTVAPWYTFDDNGTLKNNGSVTAADISVAFNKSFTIPANGSVTLSFVATVRDTLAHAQSAVDTALGQTASYWFTQTQSAYATWLAGGKSVLSAPHVQNIIQNEYRWVVSLSRELKNVDGLTADGIFLVDLNLNVINDLCSQINLGSKGYVFIVDGNGNIVYHPQQQLIYSNLRTEKIAEVTAEPSGSSFEVDDAEGKRFYSVKDTNFGWKIVGVAYETDLIGYKSTLGRTLLITLVAVAISLFVSVVLSHRLSRPIRNLQRSMRLVEKGDFDVQAEVTQMNEIGQLSRTFNMMVGQIKNLMEEIIRTQENKRRSELQALQAQINPHFLYNTLDSIVWMAEQKQHEEVVLMTSALAKLFRAGIAKDQELVPIRVEMEHIRNYLLIQKMRYANKLDYRLEFNEAILNDRTPKILLQPFVENAIYHGIRNKPDIGTIVIRAMERGGRIVFEIEDDGLGMTEEQLEKIRDTGDGEYRSKGIGISNVDERIKLICGPTYGVRIRSEREVGTCVTITIPKWPAKG